MSISPIEEPTGGGGGQPNPTYVSGLAGYLVERYSCNLVVDQELKVIDLLNDVIFPSARMYLSQGANGQIRVQNKKPADWGLGTAAFAAGENFIQTDDIRNWIDNYFGFLLIDPHTNKSEIKKVTDANYSLAQNSVTLTASVNIAVAPFSGCDGGNTPAVATLTVNSVNAGNVSSFVLDGKLVEFTGGTGDTPATIAAFIAAAINGNPKTNRRFAATANAAVATIKGKFGSLILNSDLLNAHGGPLANPTAAPVVTALNGGNLAAGVYKIAYSFETNRGQTLLSPVAAITLTVNQKIDVAGISPPAGVTVNWYITPGPNSVRIRLHSNNNGSGFVINSLPLLTAQLPPEINRTGTEIMRIRAAFSDRKETRSNLERSNVLRASFEWLLGNRDKSYNRVDLKYRDHLQDFRLMELRLSDLAHIEKVKKTENVEVNGQAIHNTFQAVRIAAGILAEARDADFFYKWSSTRESLLLEEGDVVCITDRSSGVINLPVYINGIDLDIGNASLPKVSFSARKYSSFLYDDSIAERVVPIFIEPAA